MTRLFAAAAILVAWFAAFAVELMARGMYGAYQVFGADLPSPTLLTFDAVRSYAGWGVVAAGTLVILWLQLRRSARLGQACAALALITALGTSFAVFSIMLPQVKMCGNLLPDWPAPKSNQVAQAPRAGSCAR